MVMKVILRKLLAKSFSVLKYLRKTMVKILVIHTHIIALRHINSDKKRDARVLNLLILPAKFERFSQEELN